MNEIQPGDGYTFSASSSGFTIDVIKPWTPPQDTGLVFGIALPKFPDINFPPDIPPLPTFQSPANQPPLQFQCRVAVVPVSGTPTPVIQVAKGSVTYTHSLMPFIKTGPFTDHRQAVMNHVAVKSSDVTLVPLADATSPWMQSGGGYALSGTGRWFLTLSKWDVGNGAYAGGLLDENFPWVSLVKEGSAEYDALFVDTGPSLYQNTTNVQKMTGYEDVVTVGETTMDWGHCHTTYFNPRFFGHHVRVLAVIEDEPAVPSTASVVVVREGGVGIGNEVQQVVFTGEYKSGTVTFVYGATTTGTAFNPSTDSAYDLQLCLDTIPALKGNVYCQQVGPGVFQVEFTNILRNTNVGLLGVNSALTSFTTWYKVTQRHVGSQDIVIPCELNATFLMNQEAVTEAEDPYYLNEAGDWDKVVNHMDATAANALAFIPSFASAVVGDTTPRTFTKRILNYAEVGGCTDEPSSMHPFKVIHVGDAEGLSTYRIVSGTVNNQTPGNIADEISVSTDEYEVWVKIPYDSGATPSFPAATGFEWNIGTPVPDDTADEGYVRIATVNGSTITQYVTGSLWADRIQVGAGSTVNAFYYYARI